MPRLDSARMHEVGVCIERAELMLKSAVALKDALLQTADYFQDGQLKEVSTALIVMADDGRKAAEHAVELLRYGIG